MVDDAKAIEIGRAVLALLSAIGIGHATPTTYDQNRQLPPGTSRDAYLRRHRDKVRVGVEGWSRVGQSRIVTATAWAADVERETRLQRTRRSYRPLRTANDVEGSDDGRDELDRQLGIRTRRPA